MPRTAIIMCVRHAGDGAKFEQSLIRNCGFGAYTDVRPYELIEVVNAGSMGQGYNMGVSRARAMKHTAFDAFVFTHSDVTVWAGRGLWDDALDKARTAGTGFVGVAGNAYGISARGSWWDNPTTPDGNRGAAAHTSLDHQGKEITYVNSYGPFGEAIVMDGVFLACSASTQSLIGTWPEDLGWHFYDVWATVRAHRMGLRNHVVPLPLHHQSVGTVVKDWEQMRDRYLKLYFPGR